MPTDNGYRTAKRKRGPSAVELDNITKSNKTVKLPSAAATTTEGGEIIPPGLYLDIQKALALTNHLKNKYHRPSIAELRETEIRIRSRVVYFKKAKMLPRGWTYDLANASNLVPDTSPPKVIPHSSEKKPARCCAHWVIDPNEVFPQTTKVPLNEEEKKIWLGFKKLDETNPGHFGINLATLEEHRTPIEVDNPIVSLVGNFAVAAFNEAIKMYVKKDVHNNLSDFKFVECNYLKMNEDSYYFTIILEAIEEGKAGVYETKVTLGWEDDGRKVVYYQQRTHPGSWSDPEKKSYSGLERREKKSSCRGYDYYTPWDNFRIILRGKDVIHHNIVNDMMTSQKIPYKPAQPAADGVTKNDKNQMSADVTTDFVKDAKDHIDAEGFNVYHKNWLIKPFWRIWNAAGSDGRGKCGPSEILKHPRPVEYAQYDVTPQAYVSTSRKSPFKASTSSKVLKESTNSIPFKVNQNNAQTLNANGYASVGHIGDIVEELRKKNHRLKQRGGSTDSEMINSVSAV
ncbi:microrchidia 7-like protein [Tanacetum coccineum]